jgi:hypothetical protein
MKREDGIAPVNFEAWAIGEVKLGGRFHVRRVVWGRLLAREEKRPGEEIRRAYLLVAKKPS